MDINIKYNTPIIIVFGYSRGYGRHFEAVSNPVLKDVEFYKVKDAFQTFQEINMFMNGPLCSRKEIEPQPVSEKVSLMKHGMDKRSFKH